MAEAQQSLLKNSSSIGNIQESLNAFGSSLRKANSTSSSIVKSLYEGNRDKKRAIIKQRELFQKRREAVQRREQEDIVEAGKVGSVYRRTSKVISGSTKGFLGRVMDFVGSIMVGWLVNNLPRIIKGAQDLIERVQSLIGVLTSWTDGLGNFFNDFTGQLNGILGRNKNLSIESDKREAENSQKDLDKGVGNVVRNMEQMITQFIGFDLVKALGLKKEDGGQLDSTQPPGAGASQPSGGSSGGGGGGKWKPLLDVIGAAEGGYTSIAPGDSNPDLTRMTIAQAANSTGLKGGKGAIGRYQLTSPLAQAKRAGLGPNDIFSPANQDKIAIQLIKERGGDDWLRGKITTDRFALKLAQEWAGLPKDSGGKSYYAGDGRNAARVSWGAVMAALKKVKETPRQSSPPKIDSGASYRKNQDVSSILGAPAKITSIRGEMRKNGPHGGLDIGCAAGLYISLRGVDAEVVGTQSGGAYGNVIDIWIPSLGIQLRFAHNSRILIRSGKIPAGTSFAVTGSTGRSTGPHIHLEADTERGKIRGGGNTSPNPYVALIRLTSAEIRGVKSEAPKISSTPGTTQAEVSAPERTTDVAQSVTSERRGRTIPIPIPTSNVQQQAAPQGGGGGTSITLGGGDQLNTFIIKALLRELEYT